MTLTTSTTSTSAATDCCPAEATTSTATDTRQTGAAAAAQPARRVTRRFVRHYLEMVVAMFVGMTVLGLGVEWLIAAAGAHDLARAIDGPIASAVVMCLYMVAGMAAWMAYRRHTVRQNVEMNLAMVAPMAVLVPLEIGGVIDGHALMVWLHVLMLASMWLYMLWRPMTHCHSASARPESTGLRPC